MQKLLEFADSLLYSVGVHIESFAVPSASLVLIALGFLVGTYASIKPALSNLGNIPNEQLEIVRGWAGGERVGEPLLCVKRKKDFISGGVEDTNLIRAESEPVPEIRRKDNGKCTADCYQCDIIDNPLDDQIKQFFLSLITVMLFFVGVLKLIDLMGSVNGYGFTFTSMMLIAKTSK